MMWEEEKYGMMQRVKKNVYRSVENATYEMLGMTGEEARKAFLTMYRN